MKMTILAISVLSAIALRGECDATLTEGWRFAKDPSCKADWSAEALDDSAWQQVRVPHDWAIAGPFTTNEASGITGRLPWKGVGYPDDHFWKIAAEKEQIVMDGVPGYNEKAQFTNGKVINLSADYIDGRIYSILGDYDTKVALICDRITRQEDMSRKLTFVLYRIRQLRQHRTIAKQ